MTNEQRCATCRYWVQLFAYWRGVGEDRNACARMSAGEDDPDAPNPTLAFVYDPHGGGAAVETRADFGCVMWEPRGEGQ